MKKHKKDGLEAAIKMIVYPIIVVVAVLFGIGKKRRKK